MSAGHPLEDGELLMAAMYGDMKKAKLLLRQKADIDVKGPNDATPLLLASRNGFSEMVKLLISQGAEIEARSDNGATSLLWATYCGWSDTVSTLLDLNSDIGATANDGNGVLHAAVRGAQAPTGEGCSCAAVLLARGADVTAKAGGDEMQVTPLQQARADLEKLDIETQNAKVQALESVVKLFGAHLVKLKPVFRWMRLIY